MLSEARRTLPAGEGEAIWRDFEWRIPKDFSIARTCCDDWAELNPDRVAIIDVAADGRRRDITYGELKDRSDRLASALLKLGIRKGDRVAVLLSQSAEVMVTHFATMKLGAIVLPLFTLFGADALRFRLSDSAAKVVVTDAQGAAKLAALRQDLPDLSFVISTDGAEEGALSFAELIENSHALSAVAPLSADDPAMLIYTSGTTGSPKGALQAHRFLLGHLPAVEMTLERFPQPGDIGWTPADWAWIGGLMDLAMPCLYFGAPVVAHRMRKFTPEATWSLLSETGANVLFLPPTALKMLRRSDVPDDVKIRAICSGGESLPMDLREWARAYLDASLNELYGQTECNLVACSGLGLHKPGAIGRATPGHRVSIIDGDGFQVPPGQTGEIAVERPDPVMFLGYWNLHEQTVEKFVGNWLRTGDLGRIDEDGFISFVSRDDDVITSAGYRIGPSEIENCLTGDPDVVMAAAVGISDEDRTEVVKAFVVLRDGVSHTGMERRLIDLVRERISPHVAPKSIDFVESLPMTATGKILRRSLRERR